MGQILARGSSKLFLSLLLASAGPVWGLTLTCNTPLDFNDIAAKIAAANNGDTVIVPAGIVTWTSTVTVSKGITIRGATTTDVTQIPANASGGSTSATYAPVDFSRAYNDQTILFHTSGAMIKTQDVPANQNFRLTGFTFKAAVGEVAVEGIVTLSGISTNGAGITGGVPNQRIDHCHFGDVTGKHVWTAGAVFGVADHNVHECKGPTASYQLWMSQWGGAANGDQSWAEPNYAGGNKFFFVEDNIIANRAGFQSAQTNGNLDGRNGSRAVIRHNKFYNTVGPNTHGTESLRGHRFYEVYNNNFQWDWAAGGGLMRSGGIYHHDNTYTGVLPQHGVGLKDYREDANWANFGGPTGLNPADINDYDISGNIKPAELTGTAAVADPNPATRSGGGKLTVSGPDPGWVAGRWIGHFVTNLDQDSLSNGGSLKNHYTCQRITSSGSNWVKTDPIGTAEFQPGISWAVGNRFEIRKVIAALDQSGRGGGDYVQTAGTSLNALGEYNLNWTNPTHHNNQPLEPCYSWNNIHSPGGQHLGVQSDYPTINEGTDYFNDTPAPGYTPYVYPHPLVSGSSPPPTPTPTPAPDSLRSVKENKLLRRR